MLFVVYCCCRRRRRRRRRCRRCLYFYFIFYYFLITLIFNMGQPNMDEYQLRMIKFNSKLGDFTVHTVHIVRESISDACLGNALIPHHKDHKLYRNSF